MTAIHFIADRIFLAVFLTELAFVFTHYLFIGAAQ